MNIHEYKEKETVTHMLICLCICSSQGSEVVYWQWLPSRVSCDRAAVDIKREGGREGGSQTHIECVRQRTDTHTCVHSVQYTTSSRFCVG